MLWDLEPAVCDRPEAIGRATKGALQAVHFNGRCCVASRNFAVLQRPRLHLESFGMDVTVDAPRDRSTSLLRAGDRSGAVLLGEPKGGKEEEVWRVAHSVLVWQHGSKIDGHKGVQEELNCEHHEDVIQQELAVFVLHRSGLHQCWRRFIADLVPAVPEHEQGNRERWGTHKVKQGTEEGSSARSSCHGQTR